MADQNPILIAIDLLDRIGSPAARAEGEEPLKMLAEAQRGGRGQGVRLVTEHLHVNERELIEAADIRAGEFGMLETDRERAVVSMGFCDGFLAAFKLLDLRGWDTEALQKPRAESEDDRG